ncbi:PaaI family thioesterase [Mycobacterium arosiense]|uniref:Aromatic compound degradation protein PaaI n=1 Tax=Mycobacterium arosiense ATCC BAA-1401 = DSM 45069 TaxID=1265311 RepID=A0A1W9ZCH2_MYCAI|nr:PaaI family thioesterase [Mycobacterium arosiense]ORA11382.1 aromatic compound degradation protein PaaI [Mycobacterium arosiense ATCC BAA-1401 = DSM 45069]
MVYSDARVDDAEDVGWGDPQSRLITWRDPLTTQAAAASMSGLSYWRAVSGGRLPPPPIGELVQMRVTEVRSGRVTFTCTPDGSMYNPLGTVHGGTLCTLLDTVTGCALHTTLAVGLGYTSVEIKVNYLKAVTVASGPLTAVGTVVKAGARIGFTEATATDASGALVATASSTLLIFELPSRASQYNGNSKNEGTGTP